VGGVVGYIVARLQRTWDLDARRQESRRITIRAAIDVVHEFMDQVEPYRHLDGSWPMAKPFRALTHADRWAIASVLRLFPDVTSLERFFYPFDFLLGGSTLADGSVTRTDFDTLQNFVGQRLAVLTAELEKLGDPDLRIFTRGGPMP
jgi:hypothetical protein